MDREIQKSPYRVCNVSITTTHTHLRKHRLTNRCMHIRVGVIKRVRAVLLLHKIHFREDEVASAIQFPGAGGCESGARIGTLAEIYLII